MVDPVTAFIAYPGETQQIAHRVGAEDVCTSVHLSQEYIDDLTDAGPAASRLVFTSGRIDLAHRSLVARARRAADAFEIAERLTNLAYDFFHQQTDGAPERRLPSAASTRWRIVESAAAVRRPW